VIAPAGAHAADPVALADRLPPSPTSPWWGEHRSRYHFAAALVRGARVLDAACGTGFGSEILADAGARYVVGADLQIDDVTPARAEELSFVCADGTGLPFRDAAFDVVTSFDTIEHVIDEGAFVRELRRVLAPSGWLVLSTPNALRAARRKADRQANPRRVREYRPERLRELLGAHFEHVALLGQITKPYYPVSPFWDDPGAAPPNARARLQTLAWKVENRLPFPIKDGMSRLFHNRAFFPGEFDFDFVPEEVERGHVIVAVCRP
jgi:SAM-dependent methyltransferase